MRPVVTTIAWQKLLLGLLFPFIAVQIGLAQTPAFHDVRPGYGVTDIGWLSDYHPPLRGTAGDTRIYILDSGLPGGTALIMGGTHGNEISGVIAAIMLVENALPTRGRLIVIPHANNANTDYGDSSRDDVDDRFTLYTPEGLPRTFRYGSRRTNPAYEKEPDPEFYVRSDGEVHPGEEIRNLNRVYPGRPDGTLTEQIAYGIVRLMMQEQVDIAIDLHEASTTSPIANTIVAHEDALEIAAHAVIDLSVHNIHINIEQSREQFRGLSHREWGDHTSALAFLTETANPGQTPEIVNPDVIDDDDNPLQERVARQIAMIFALLHAATEVGVPPVTATGVPTYEQIVRDGVGPWLNSDRARL